MVDSSVRQSFVAFANEAQPRAPLYTALCRRAAEEPAVLDLLDAAPPLERRPVLLLAAVHYLLLSTPADPLRTHYPNLRHDRSAGDSNGAADEFVRFCLAHAEQIRAVCAARGTQTNEVGRCSMLLPAVAKVHEEVRRPISLVDVGCSGGLNLYMDHYGYDYDGHQLNPSSIVQLTCGVRGELVLPHSIPTIGARIGVDRYPIDVTVESEARWLEACVWPDQIDRFDRLVAAIGIVAANPPDLRRGDAVTDVGALLDEAAAGGHAMVVNSWMLTYVSADERRAYVDELDRVGTRRDISWVFLESPLLTAELPYPDGFELRSNQESLTAVTLVRWRAGRRTSEVMAVGHPHGYWMHALD